MARRYPRREITARREHFHETETVLNFFRQDRAESPAVKLWDAETGATEALDTMGQEIVSDVTQEDLDCPILRGMLYGVGLSMILVVIAQALVLYVG